MLFQKLSFLARSIQVKHLLSLFPFSFGSLKRGDSQIIVILYTCSIMAFFSGTLIICLNVILSMYIFFISLLRWLWLHPHGEGSLFSCHYCSDYRGIYIDNEALAQGFCTHFPPSASVFSAIFPSGATTLIAL